MYVPDTKTPLPENQSLHGRGRAFQETGLSERKLKAQLVFRCYKTVLSILDPFFIIFYPQQRTCTD